MEASNAERSGNLVFEIKNLNISFDSKCVVNDFSATVMRGDRIGITGPNGAGKTSLVKAIIGEIEKTKGKLRTGVNVEIQYFDQYHEALDLDKSVADNVADGHTEVTVNGKSKHVISYLANFLFTGRRARSPVRVLSGGEKNRLLLARMFAKPSNVLIMDEPTNDLDLETLDLLEDLLATYEGAVIVISHDRRFIDKVATETWVFDGRGGIETVVGGWSDVLDYYARVGRSINQQNEKPSDKEKTVKTVVKENKTKSGISFSEKHELEKLPAKIEELEGKLSLLDEKLNAPETYADDGSLAREISKDRESVQAELDKVYARWEELELKANGEN